LFLQLSAERAFETNARDCATQKQGVRSNFTDIAQNFNRPLTIDADAKAKCSFRVANFNLHDLLTWTDAF
jgi:hypothetical protein